MMIFLKKRMQRAYAFLKVLDKEKRLFAETFFCIYSISRRLELGNEVSFFGKSKWSTPSR